MVVGKYYIYFRKEKLNGGCVRVTLNEESGISPLQGDRESLEEEFNLFCVSFSPTPCALTRHVNNAR